MYVYKVPVEQAVSHISSVTLNSHCPRLNRLTEVQVQRCAPWGRAALSSMHAQVCSGTKDFSAELWVRAFVCVCVTEERETDSHVTAFSWEDFALRSAAPQGRQQCCA